jgi:tRNA/tmRNA/rRNA uracil-C5-methylase (TrmA/RlmC/RlmD family)
MMLMAPQAADVSCTPATLARDFKRMAPRTGWNPFDRVPQTAHVESVALLVADS